MKNPYYNVSYQHVTSFYVAKITFKGPVSFSIIKSVEFFYALM